MHGGWTEEFVRDRNALLLAEAQERRLARQATGASYRGKAHAADTGGTVAVRVRGRDGQRGDLARGVGEVGGAKAPVKAPISVKGRIGLVGVPTSADAQ